MEGHTIVKRKHLIAARAAGAATQGQATGLHPVASPDPSGLEPAPEEEEGVRLMEQAVERANLRRRVRVR